MEININSLKQVHFIGIGGIGISAIANLMKTLGKTVSGSDMSESPITHKLLERGIHVTIGHDKNNIPENTDLVIHTIAIPEHNPELREAHARNIPCVTYPYMLSVLSKNMYTIAISGTHGKTTTTAMLSQVMIDAHMDPTVIVGSLLKNSDSNLVVGESKYFLVEACEYRRSFLNLYPTILVITNIEADHLDYYADLSDIQSAFRELAERIPEHGVIVCNPNNEHIKSILKKLKCRIIDYTKYVIPTFRLKVPGKHNQENAACAFAVSQFLNILEEQARNSLHEFSGTWRRFDLKGITKNGTTVYDDYAHHPQEIEATLSGFKEMFPDKKRVVFFQPHLYSRTKILLDEFSRAFTDADEIYILPIYAAREVFDPSISHTDLVQKICTHEKKAYALEKLDDVVDKIQKMDSNTVVITMGAGDVYTIGEKALNK